MRIFSVIIALSMLVLSSCEDSLGPTSRGSGNSSGTSLVGNWLLEKEIWGAWTGADSSLTEYVYPNDDSASMVIWQILVDSIQAAGNILSTSEYTTESYGHYTVLSDSTLVFDGDTGFFELSGSILSIMLVVDVNEFGVPLVEGWELSRYTASFPPQAWLEAVEATGLDGYWILSRVVEQYGTGPQNILGTEDTTFNTTDLANVEIDLFASDSLHYYLNDPGTSSYSHESIPITVTETTIDISLIPFEYSLSGNDLHLWFEAYPDTASWMRLDIYFVRYTGPFPPTEWLTPGVSGSGKYERDKLYWDGTNFILRTAANKYFPDAGDVD